MTHLTEATKTSLSQPKKSLIAPQMVFHAPTTASLNPSKPPLATTKYPTSAAIAVTRRVIGLAAVMTMSAFCAKVMPFVATVHRT